MLTILGTSGIQDTVIMERMTGNFRDSSLAFEAAEAELRRWEVEMANPGFTFNTSTLAFYDVTDSTNSVDPGVDANYGRSAYPSSLSVDFSGLSAAPEYYMERLPEITLPNSSLVVGFQDIAPTIQYYRVTAKGYGVSPSAEVILQSTYLR